MRRAIFLPLAAVVAALLAGCACPPKGSAPGDGRVLDLQYEACNLPRGTGEIVVLYDHLHPPPPRTQWALVGNYGPTPWRDVGPGSVWQKDADTYGVIFRFKPPQQQIPGGPCPPEDMLVTLLEEQRLFLRISYLPAPAKKCEPIARRTWR
jgi:hypothetical protein